jgi:predicted MFS family arabinose efflux permease
MHGDIPLPAPDPKTGRPWWQEMTGYHYFVFAVASMGWLFDTMDQQLFVQARAPALKQLLAGTGGDEQVWGGITTMVFMWGWATGGIIFGILGDRIGRARTMVLTIFLYSLFTGLSAISQTAYDFSLYRFLTGLGVGGEFAVGVALVAEVMPDRIRPHALGLLQALSAVGNIAAGVIGMVLGGLKEAGVVGTPWRIMFLIGVIPALLALLVMRRLREPERWKAVSAEQRLRQQLGSYRELFGNPRWKHNAIVGLLLASSGVIGLWGIGFFSSELVRSVFKKTLDEGQLFYWVGIVMIVQNIGGGLGVYAFSWVTHFTGRRPAFALAFVLALVSTAFTFWFLRSFSDVFWMIPIMGFCQLAMFGGYAIYFPELFPTRLRSTGTSFCYNVGRYVASVGPLTLNLLASRVFGGSIQLAGVTMCVFFLLGLFVLPFAPETKGHPLPE